MISPKPIKYNSQGRITSPKGILSGLNKTNAISKIEAREAKFNFLFLKKPISNNDFSERML